MPDVERQIVPEAFVIFDTVAGHHHDGTDSRAITGSSVDHSTLANLNWAAAGHTIDADIDVLTTNKVTFRDAAIFINSSVDGQLDIDADVEVEITTTTLDINAAVDISSTLTMNGNIVMEGVTLIRFFDTSSASIRGDGSNNLFLDAPGSVQIGLGVFKVFQIARRAIFGTDAELQFRDTAIMINSSTDGQMDIDADVELELTAPRIQLEGKVNLGAEGDLTISAGGAVAVTKTYHSIIVNGGAGSGADQLDTATGGSEGDILILKATTTGVNDTVTVADGTGAGTFILAGGANFVMDTVDDRLTLLHNGTEWVEWSRSENS